MMNFTLIPALLCTFSWISVSVSEFYTVEVQPGEEVTLQCSNFTSLPTNILWFKLEKENNVSCISSMSSSEQNASYCDGIKDGKFNMTSNTTTLFLKIKSVDLSDSVLYFCGFYQGQHAVIVSATYLTVQGVLSAFTNVTTVILTGILVFLLMVIISLVVKLRTVYTAHHEEVNPQHTENVGSDSLNYAALSFRPKAKSNRRPEREQEQHVVYAATR